MTTPTYPIDEAGRQQLADELTAAGWVPTQPKADFRPKDLADMIAAMHSGVFDWVKASLGAVIMGPGGEVIGGHHAVVAAHLAGVDLFRVPGPRPQVQPVPVNYRPTYDWIDVLPDVI